MADQKAVEPELDDEGKPIPPPPAKEEEPNTSEEGTDEGEGPAPKEEEGKEDEQIPVRRSAAQHIIARKNRTIEKLRSKVEEDEEPEASSEEDEDLSPVTKGAVAREVERHVKPLLKTIASRVDEDELSSLFTQDPEAKRYEKRIRAYMEHPVYQGVPAEVIFNHLSAKDKKGEGARRKKIADAEANQARGGGTARRPAAKSSGLPTAEEIAGMDDEAFEALDSKVRQGGFVHK